MFEIQVLAILVHVWKEQDSAVTVISPYDGARFQSKNTKIKFAGGYSSYHGMIYFYVDTVRSCQLD